MSAAPAAKGLYGRLTSAARPPRPGSMAFRAWRLLTSVNTVAYRLTGGRVGGSFDGAPVVLLHHVGRRSGEARVAPLLYLEDGDDVVVVASYGGAPKHPAWFHNLRDQPETVIELGRERRPVRAEVATAADRKRLWPQLVARYPAFADYQARTEREIPLVILRRRDR